MPFTSKASGDWGSEGQTTWNEVGKPASGQAVSIAQGHDIAITGAEESGAITTNGKLTIDAGGSLLVDALSDLTMTDATDVDWAELIVKGTLTLPADLQMADYSRLEIGPGGQMVAVDINMAVTAQDESELKFVGTAGSRATLQLTGGFNGNGTQARQIINWQYADITFAADSIISCYGHAPESSILIDECYINGSNTAYLRLGKYSFSQCPTEITNTDFREMDRDAGWFVPLDIGSTTGNTLSSVRTFSNNTVEMAVAKPGKVLLRNAQWVAEDNVFYNSGLHSEINITPEGDTVTFNRNFVYGPVGSAGSGWLRPDPGTVNITNNIVIDEKENAYPLTGGGHDSGLLTYRYNIVEMSDSTGDNFQTGSSIQKLERNIVIGVGNHFTFGNGWTGDKTVIGNTCYISLNGYMNILGAGGETAPGTGVIKFFNNLAINPTANPAIGIKEVNDTDEELNETNYNYFWSEGGGAIDLYNNVKIPKPVSGYYVEGVDPEFGANDEDSIDPQFADSSVNFSKWDTSLGGPGTLLNVATEMLKKNEHVPGDTYKPAYNIAAGLAYIRAGFTPNNIALKDAGDPTYAVEGSYDIGAVDYAPAVATTRDTNLLHGLGAYREGAKPEGRATNLITGLGNWD